ncbi:MAG: ribose-phosphate pyrophosphokinase [Bacteroidales bacterium]|nr:ribose-phosphate pyrophosphokinase [Bacteroidales bacterium]
MANEVTIIAGRATKNLAEKIAASYGTKLGNVVVQDFSDGEFQPSFEHNIRGHEVYIIQSTTPPADNLFEMLMMVDAAKRASAKSVIAVIPYFGFARQDRKDKPRVSIASKMIANLLSAAGVNRVVTMDLHADQIQGFFDLPVDHLYGSSIFIPKLKEMMLENLTIASPDTGGTKRASAYAKIMNTDFIISYKHRAKPNEVADMAILGDVTGRDVVLVDDIIDTAGTITRAAQMIMDNGANSVRAMVTHPVLSGSAYEKLENSVFTEIFVTDSIPLKHKSEKIKVLSCADIFAEVIHRVNNHRSISSIFY